MRRDMIQGYIDGYLAVGGDRAKLAECLDLWMKNHPVYPMSDTDRSVVLEDLPSYRGVSG